MADNFELELIDSDDDNSVFQNSCKVAIIINTLKERISKNANLANTSYFNDHEFIVNYQENNYVSASTFTNILIGIIALAFTIFFLTIFWGMVIKGDVSSFIGFIVIIIWLGLIFLIELIIKKIKMHKLLKDAVCLLPKYRNERDNFYNNRKPALMAQIKDDNDVLNQANDYLKSISNNRNCITKEYYQCAGELLYLYKVKRADNLKEAINVWENIQFQLRQAEVLSEISATVEYNTKLAQQACEYARQAAIDADYASTSSDINSLMLYLNLIK